jgi:predicted P-loop ATPase
VADDAELSEFGRAALGYLGLGLAVIPIVAKDKRPASAHGVNDWTDNPDQVRLWWSEHPRDNVGIVCGTPSRGLLVIDLDVSDEKDGLATLKEWETTHGELPETAEEITGGGGRHLLYRTGRTNIHPSTNRALGVDVRADGSYIVAAPSVHPSGERYEWWAAPDDVGIADATDDVYDFVDYVQRNGGTDDALKDRQDGGFSLPDEIVEGERDDTLFRYGSRLRRFGRNDSEILNELTGVNLLRCKPPMSMEDVRRIAKSCCRYERGSESSDVEVGAPHKQASAAEGEGFQRSKNGAMLQTTYNAVRAVMIDERLSGRLWYNGMSYQRMVTLPLPWDDREGERAIKDTDYIGLTAYIEKKYGITGVQRITQAAQYACEKNSRNPCREWLDSLEWDGRYRIGTLVTACLGADDTAYNREVERLFMLGAVSRVYEPGCKFDYVPILIGNQGIGKSRYVRLLAHHEQWYTDNFNTLDGDAALEKIRGLWIAELAELLATKRAREVEAIKAFVTSTTDVIRPKYARETEQRKRVCVFIGTTNEHDFLTDSTGNRRFLPVECKATACNPWMFSGEAPEYVEQMWAEAVHAYKTDHPSLVMPENLADYALTMQTAHTEDDPLVGLVQQWAGARLESIKQSGDTSGVGARVCVREVYDAMPEDVRRGNSRYVYKALARAMDSCHGWVREAEKMRTRSYGTQRVWVPDA